MNMDDFQAPDARESSYSALVVTRNDQLLSEVVGPLLHLQRSIALLFEGAHESFASMPAVAVEVRKGALLCRIQLLESTKLLRKVEQTATSVLNLFQDLDLAVEVRALFRVAGIKINLFQEGEPELAAEFFNVVKQWVTELQHLIHETQSANQTSMERIHDIVKGSANALIRAAEGRPPSTIRPMITNGNVSIPMDTQSSKSVPEDKKRTTIEEKTGPGYWMFDSVKRLKQAASSQVELTETQVLLLLSLLATRNKVAVPVNLGSGFIPAFVRRKQQEPSTHSGSTPKASCGGWGARRSC
jgi:hypothetical protein